MNMSRGWIAVDLDGTLALYDKWRGNNHIGEPVPRMLERVKNWLAAGKDVRIFTARVSPVSIGINGNTFEETVAPINAWCEKHLGTRLPVTHEKDLSMIELWDDRCVQVIPNTGERVDGKFS